MFCKNCGSPIDPNSPFCPNCGCANTPDPADSSTTNDMSGQNNYNNYSSDQNNYNGYTQDPNNCSSDQNNYNGYTQDPNSYSSDQNNYNGYTQDPNNYSSYQNNYNGYTQDPNSYSSDQNNYNGYTQDPNSYSSDQNNYNGYTQNQNNYNGYAQDPSQNGYNNYSQNSSTYNGAAPDQNFSSIDPKAAGKKDKKRSKKSSSGNGGRKSKIPFIVGGCVLAAILVIAIVGVAFAAPLKNFYYKTFASEQNYQNYVIKKSLDDSLDTFVNQYDTVLSRNKKALDKGLHGELALDIEPAASDFLSEISYMDMDWLKSISLNYDQKNDEEMFALLASASLNDSPVVSMNITGDKNVNEFYTVIPELSDKYIGFSLEDISEETLNMSTDADYFSLMNLPNYLPEGKDLKKILPAYYTSVLDNIKNVKKGKETLAIDKLSDNCIKLTTKISDKDLYNIAMTCLEQAKSDKDLKKIIINLLDGIALDEETSSEELYDDFIDVLDEAMDSLKSSKDDLSGEDLLCVEVWVTSSGDIAGICLSDVDSEYIYLEYYCLNDKKGSETFISVMENFYITGSDTVKKGKTNGTYTISSYDTDLVSLEIKDFDQNDFENGFINGSYILKLDNNVFSDMMDAGPASAILSQFNIRMDFAAEKESSKVKCSFLNGSDPIVSVNISEEIGTDEKFSFPPEDAVILNGTSEEDLQEYGSDIDLSSIVDSLDKAGVPSELLDTLE